MTADLDTVRLARLADIAKLGGETALGGFLQRFGTQLEVLRQAPDWSREAAHKIVGLAGMFGFCLIEQAWSAIEYTDGPVSEAMKAEAMAAVEEGLAFIKARPG